MADRVVDDAARAELQAMSRRSPEDFDLLFMQAQLAYKSGRKDQARTLLQQYLDVQNQRQDAIAAGATDPGAAAADARVLLSRLAEDQGHIDPPISPLGQIQDPSLHNSSPLTQATSRPKTSPNTPTLGRPHPAPPDNPDTNNQGGY